MQLAIRQSRMLAEFPFEDHVDVDKIKGLVIDICDQLEKVVKHSQH